MCILGVILGIIGGGQLGMMHCRSCKKYANEISKVIVDPVQDCPATHTGASQIVADFENSDAIKELAEKSDIITYEIE